MGKRAKGERGSKRQKLDRDATDDMPTTSAGSFRDLPSSTAPTEPAAENDNEVSRRLLNSAQIVICDEGT